MDGLENLVFDFDETLCFSRRRLRLGCDTGDEVASVSDLLNSHRVLVFGDGQHAEFIGRVRPCGDCYHPREFEGLRDVYREDSSIVMR